MRYTKNQAMRDNIRDQITDIRRARRDGLPDYAAECEIRVRVLWERRHTSPGTDRYGWPLCWATL